MVLCRYVSDKIFDIDVLHLDVYSKVSISSNELHKMLIAFLKNIYMNIFISLLLKETKIGANIKQFAQKVEWQKSHRQITNSDS